jgi:hypothetical protein
MHARHVTLQLKRDIYRDFPRIMDQELLPLLRKQKGFVHELVLIAPNQIEAVAISLWEEKEHADKFNRDVYPEIVRMLEKYTEGTPLVKNFDLQYATVPTLQTFVKAMAV